VLCPHCQSDQVIKAGTTKAGKQRYRWHCQLNEKFTPNWRNP
jgi:transposase-like protein